MDTTTGLPGGIDFFELRASHCRFPIEGEGIDMRYCGAAVECGSYCAHHATITNDRSQRALLKADKRELARLTKL